MLQSTDQQLSQSTEFPVSTTFGIAAPANIRVQGFTAPHPLTPPLDPLYRFRAALLSDVLRWHRGRVAGEHHDGLWLTGPMGSGKSSVIRQVAARLNLPLIEVNAKARLEVADLIGYRTVLGGDILFQDGPLTQALRVGAWLLLNEVDLMDPGELAGLNTVLDGGPLVMAENGGEGVHPAPGFGLLCTANSAGHGDRSGLYAGVRRMNGALLDRFWVVDVGYPTVDEEQALLAQQFPSLPAPVREWMVAVAHEVRRLATPEETDAQALDLPFSTRALVRWAYLTLQFKGAPSPLHHALKRALTARAEPETAEAIHQIVQRITGESHA